jgi:Hsp70 protein
LLDRAQFVDVADGIGLSVGAAKLTAVHVGRSAVTRTAVLTRYPNRPAEVGVPGENPNLAERGLIITDFVDRVGDPVAIIAADGSSHPAEVVLAEALRALLVTVAGNGSSGEPVGVAYPAHWRPAAVDALNRALAELPEFRSPTPALLVSDATAALTALQQDPGVPTRGIIALCDFGGTGTSITLVDAARGFQPVGPTVRYEDLSGDLIDQALLTSIVSDMSAAGTVDLSSTSAIGSLTRLRAQCRAAKERLSTAAVTSLKADLPGSDGELRVTRTELDAAIGQPLAGFVDELQHAIAQSGIRPSELVAVATVGGGARMPIITTTLSEHLRVPVITAGQPELAAAIGSGLKAVRGTVAEDATSLAPAAAVGAATALAPAAAEAPLSSTFHALAWSDADDVPEVAPSDHYDYDDFRQDGSQPPSDEGGSARPEMAFEPAEFEDEVSAEQPWYRSLPVIIGAAMLLVLVAVGWALVVVLRGDSSTEPTGNTMSVTATPTTSLASPAPQTEAPPPPTDGQETQTVIEQAPPPAVTVTEQAPGQPAPAPPPAEAPPVAPSSEAPPPPPASEPPPASQPPAAQPPASQAPVSNPPSTTMFTIPGPIPIPIPIQVPGSG